MRWSVWTVSHELYLALKELEESSDRDGHPPSNPNKEKPFMARIIVMADPTERPDAPVLLDERICSAHITDDHSATQLIERLSWAISDAENAERAAQAA
jgi:hypothetical protein